MSQQEAGLPPAKYAYVPHWQWLAWISYVTHSNPPTPDLLNLPVPDESNNAQGVGLGAHEKDAMNEMTTLLKEMVVLLRDISKSGAGVK